jgi:hypothetical protein
VTGNSRDGVVHFIRQALAVFDALIHVPGIQERVLIVDGELNILGEADNSHNVDFHRVTELVRPGY